MRRATTTVLAALALLLAGCADGESGEQATTPAASEPASTRSAAHEETQTPEPETLTAFWHVELPPDASLVTADGGCSPFTMHKVTDDRLRSLDTGDQVRIEDAAGAVVAIGELSRKPNNAGGCTWGFMVEDVPAGGQFYTAVIGDWESAVLAEDETDGMLLFDFAP